MAEQTSNNRDTLGSEVERANDLVNHWVHVIDSWVESMDQGMGGTTDGADPAIGPDSALEVG